jgi:antitoxin component of MazEF toxin-antitoxin module
MEYAAKVKSIGGSNYLLLPPKLARAHKLKSGTGVILRESGDMVIMENKNKNLDKAARDFLSMRFNLGGMTVTRKEIYETDRY